MTERLTPGADDATLAAERAVLGAVLMGQRAASVPLATTDFFRDAHHRIFAKMLELDERGDAIDFVTLRAALQQSGELDAVGGPAYLASLTDGLPRSTNVEHYAQIVVEASRARSAIGDARRFIDEVSQHPGSIGNGVGSRFALSIQQTVDAAHATAARRPLFRSARELAAAAIEIASWLAVGLLAAGAVSEVCGKAKSAGKTTFLLVLIRCLLDGEPFIGATTTRTPVVYLSEQPPASLREMLLRAGLVDRDDLSILCHADVAARRWPDIVRLAEAEAVRIGARALVVDTLGQFAGLRGDAENNSGDAYETIAPLQQSASRGFAWMVVRHDRKGAAEVGESGRGSSAFTGGVDIALRLSRPEGHQRPTLRKLEGLSRFQETPACLLLEKVSVQNRSPRQCEFEQNEIDGFVTLGSEEAVVAEQTAQEILAVLPSTEDEAQKEAELLEKVKRPRAAVQRALKLLLGRESVRRIGKGGKKDPFRFLKIDCAQTHIHRDGFEQNADPELGFEL